METVEQFIKRANINHIKTFLIHGISDATEHNSVFEQHSLCGGNLKAQTYDERIINDSKEILELIKKLSPDENTLEEAISALDKALRAYQEVYAEAGLKAGVRLLTQLLTNGNTNN